jgi:hypothetical protein
LKFVRVLFPTSLDVSKSGVVATRNRRDGKGGTRSGWGRGAVMTRRSQGGLLYAVGNLLSLGANSKYTQLVGRLCG